VVIDSAKMLRDFADERELRGALYDLTGNFAETGAVLLLLLVGEYTPEELESGIEFSLADGIIQLEYQVREPVDRRSLRVAKMRGGRHMPGRHTFQIGPDGIEIFPWPPARRLATDSPPSRWKGSCSCSTTSSTCATSRSRQRSAAHSTSSRCATAPTG
jgi:KaiC/GvpD/RAD55 family RecA-like ATPase